MTLPAVTHARVFAPIALLIALAAVGCNDDPVFPYWGTDAAPVTDAGGDAFDPDVTTPDATEDATADTPSPQDTTPPQDVAPGACGGVDCSSGQVCRDNLCVAAGSTPDCEVCAGSSECRAGSVCAPTPAGLRCLSECQPGDVCDEDYACNVVGSATLCTPNAGVCGDGGCPLTPQDCARMGDVLDDDACACVTCVGGSDCGTGEVCTVAGECVRVDDSCADNSECPGGFCVDETCVSCRDTSDCGSESYCADGECAPCDCAFDEVCSATGVCVPNATDACVSDEQCQALAETLGSTMTAACDPSIGCYTVGRCNDAATISEGLTTAEDVFDAPCVGATTCVSSQDFLSMTGRFISQCTGCDPASETSCRLGETCNASLLPPPLGTGLPTCGSDALFPFP